MDNGSSLYRHTRDQVARLCDVVGYSPRAAVELLADFLGAAGSRSLSDPPVWPSFVADDHTPLEWSVALQHTEPPTLRILGESPAGAPTLGAHLSAAHRFLGVMASRFALALDRFDQIADLFAAARPDGAFGLWHSMVLRAGRAPEFKIYFNSEMKGISQAPGLVGDAMGRLGLSEAYDAAIRAAVRPGELGVRDRPTFFALDLHDTPQARTKVYLSQHDATAGDAVRAASAVDGLDPEVVGEFCAVAANGAGPFDGKRPLVSSYTFLEQADRPVGYSLYVPIRDYVRDDAEAYDRVLTLVARYGYDPDVIRRAVAAVADRPLESGRGLIAHVSLRLGAPRPGVTVYLSSEAYGTGAPDRRMPADRCATA